MKFQKTKFFSYKVGELPTGCKFCVKGEKLVFFITGICNRSCFYCPLSEQKKNKDVVYANEWETKPNQFDIIIKEAKLTNAKGAGITGGDPLLVCERTCSAIKKLKKSFGKKFHIHLYTSLNNVNEKKLKQLYDSGLDEIRVHPDFFNQKDWNKIDLLTKFVWEVGVEIPVIPTLEKETKKLLDYINNKVDFVNLNELEMSDTNATDLSKHGFKPKNDVSYAAKGSEELALKLMQYCKNSSFNIHFCTCKLKDAVQLKQRIKKRAKNVALKTDIITKEGTLIRGAIYLPNLFPSFSYRKKIKGLTSVQRSKILNELEKTKHLLKRLNIESVLDDYKLRLLTSAKLLRKHSKELKTKNLLPAVVEEYPTHDGTEIEINPL